MNITIDADRTTFSPGDAITGRFAWEADDRPESIALRLMWLTSGRGATEAGVVDEVKFDNPGRSGEEKFSFTAPAGPNSFSGQIVSLGWALELVLQPGSASTRRDLTIAPGGKEIDLYAHATEEERE